MHQFSSPSRCPHRSWFFRARFGLGRIAACSVPVLLRANLLLAYHLARRTNMAMDVRSGMALSASISSALSGLAFVGFFYAQPTIVATEP